MAFKLTVKLPAMIAAGAAATALLVSANDYVTAVNFLERQVIQNLINVRNGRKAEVHRFLSRVHEDLEILAASHQVRHALENFHGEFRAIERQGEARAQYMQHLYNENVPTGTLGHTIVRDPAIVAYGREHDLQDQWFRHIVPVRGYGDLYLISHEGDVVYSVLKKDDFASNLTHGRWKDTGLAHVFRGALLKAGVAPSPLSVGGQAAVTAHGMKIGHGEKSMAEKTLAPAMANTRSAPAAATSDHAGHAAHADAHKGAARGHAKLHDNLDHTAHNSELFRDVSPYLPDHGAPAGFMAVPVIDAEGWAAGVLAVRFPIDRVNAIMQEGSNLGDTGDAYLVGEDFLLRSQPRFETLPQVIKQRVRNAAVEAALADREGVMETLSYDGTPVLAAFGSVGFHGTKWAIISEVDLDEIAVPTREMRDQMMLIGGALTALLILAGILLTRTVTVPLARVTETLKAFATTRAMGDLPEMKRGDEIGEIARVVHESAGDISEYIDRINEAREEQKRNEAEIRDREERIRSLLEVSPIGFVLTRFGGEILFTNEALISILRLPPEKKRVPDIGRFYSNPDDRKRYVEQIRRDGHVPAFEAQWTVADGTPIWVTISAKLIDFDGDTAIMAWVDDITQRKTAEEVIARKEAQLSAAMASMSDGLFMLDEDGVYELFNDNYLAFCRRSELAMDKVRLGQSILPVLRDAAERRLYGEGDAEEQARTRFNAIRSGDEVRAELQIPNGDWYELRKTPRATGGSVVLLSDISERKAAEAEIARQRTILATTLETMEQGISMIDGDLNVQAHNTKFMELLEFPPEDFPGDITLEALFRYNAERGEYGEGDIEEQVQSRLDLSRTFEAHQFERTRPDGTVIEIRGNPLPDKDGFVTTYTDITQRVQAERTIADAMALISESIQYASRIQRSVLPTDAELAEAFDDHFAIWQPKDVVGGDVYHLRTCDNGTILMVADCTGHGVPGAFMTMIATGALDQALIEIPSGNPGALLQRINQLVKETLGQDGDDGESDDGFECGLCLVDSIAAEITYAGARFELWCLKDEDEAIDVVRGDKPGIGYRRTPRAQAFANHIIALNDYDAFYLTTDGMIDQIGGPKRRAFGKRRAQATILGCREVAMAEQADHILKVFAAYQGAETRRDDLTVFGFLPKSVDFG